QVKAIEGYQVTAVFYKVGGLQTGSDVRVNGIKVGSVISEELDPETYNAVVRMSIRSDVKLPMDTVAAIGSEGILGGKYIRIDPGKETTFIVPGGQVKKTSDYRSLEDQVGEIIFLASGGSDKSK
ncbi:MAG: MCE family protein, partial [Rhodospirillaceae bacterium]|nr:MCE family protein [Rhodospirillaceae bacterium]